MSFGSDSKHKSTRTVPGVLHVKSKFDAEFRRFSCQQNPETPLTYSQFRDFIGEKHSLKDIPFTLCYRSLVGDLLPITNDENFRKAFESAVPVLRVLVQRKGESWEEKYGYGTETLERKRRGFTSLFENSSKPQRQYNISSPEDFRQVSAIIDVDLVPPTHRRVRLCKYNSDRERPLGFYIRTGTSVRLTPQSPIKSDGIFISRLVENGLAESTGLLGVGDEVIEVNGIDVHGKTIDQVSDMMVANAHNLIITIIPASQRNTVNRSGNRTVNTNDDLHYAASDVVNGRPLYRNTANSDSSDEDEEDDDHIINHVNTRMNIN